MNVSSEKRISSDIALRLCQKVSRLDLSLDKNKIVSYQRHAFRPQILLKKRFKRKKTFIKNIFQPIYFFSKAKIFRFLPKKTLHFAGEKTFSRNGIIL